MKVIDKVKCLSEEKRRIVILVVLFFLALPLLFLVIRNFKTRMAVLQQTKPEILPLPEITTEVSQSWDELQQAREDFNEQRELLEIWGGFGSSTMPTSAAEINFEDI